MPGRDDYYYGTAQSATWNLPVSAKHMKQTNNLRRSAILAVLAVTWWRGPSTLAQNLVANGSFESPTVSGDTYTVTFGSLTTNGVPDWAFGLSASASYDGIAFTSGAFGDKVIEDGSNAAFDQGTGSFWQVVTLGGGQSYVLSFHAMGRAGLNGADPIKVTLGNILSQTVTPGNAAQTSLSDWSAYAFAVTATNSGSYRLEFAGTLPFVSGTSDHTTYIDNISLRPYSSNAPAILVQPSAAQWLFAGQTAQFAVQAASVPAPSYQWQTGTNGVYLNLADGGRISGATSGFLTISNLSVGDPTNFQVIVSDAAGSTNSTPAALTVMPIPPPGSPRVCVTVINPGFEDNPQGDDIYTTPFGSLNPANGIAGWHFNASAGDAYSGLVVETGTVMGSPKYIPQCWQAAFIQGTGSFSQPVTFKSPGTYLLRFRAAGRSNGGAGAETVVAAVDGQAVGTFTPATTQWALFASAPFVVAAGVHTITFAGTVPYSQSDRTSFIDAVQIVTPAEAVAATPPTSPVDNLVFVGDSITAGATLVDPATQASAVQCGQSLGERYNMAMRLSNQGHSGHTTVDWLPSTNASSDFELAVAAAAALQAAQAGQLIFSIMLGANDSAQSGPNGAPVSAANYRQNLQAIIDRLLAVYTNAFIFVHYPTWYSTNTQNSSLYGAAGLARLETYFPQIDLLVSNCAIVHPGRVFAGDKQAFGYFSTNYLTLLTPETGPQGTFYLHPNAAGAAVLGKFWADAIAAPLNWATNDSYVAWLQSVDLTPNGPDAAFDDTSTNGTVSNGVAYANPNGIVAVLAADGTLVNVWADLRTDAELIQTVQTSNDLQHWVPVPWSVATNQAGVATGFTRYALQAPVARATTSFYRLQLGY